MNFAFPAALFLGALAPILIALYLHRPSRRRLEVSTLMFWQKVLEREPHRRFLGRLRHPLSLLLQLLILLLLLLALARPEPGRDRGATRTVIVLDARARMQAENGAVFRDAVRAAQDLSAQSGPGSETALLAVEGAPRLVSEFSGDPRDLRERLAALAPSDAGGGLEETLSLGRELLGSTAGKTRLILISDRVVPDLPGVEQVAVGRPADNAAIVEFALRPLPASPQTSEVLVKLGNFSNQDRAMEFELLLDGKPIDLQTLRAAPGAEVPYLTTITPGSGEGFLTARLTAPDALAVDNTARTVLAAEPRVRTLLLTGGNPFLEGALGANPGVALDILNPSAWQPAMNSGFDVVVYDNWLPEGFSPDAPGARGSLFLGKSPFAAPGETAVAPIAETVDAASPLLWNVGLDAVRIFQSGSLTLPTDGRWRTNIVLANAGQPILATLEQPGGARMVAAAFAVPDSNMPLRAAFPLFMSNAVRWLAGRAGSDTPNRRAGEIFVPGPKVEISTGPRETADTSKPADTAPSLTGAPLRLGKNGFYEVREPGGSRWLAVNTTDARESDLRAATRRAALLATVHAGLALWQWLAIAAAALLVTEWYLHHRRVTE